MRLPPEWMLAVSLGAVVALGHAPLGYWWASLAAFVVLFSAYDRVETPRNAFRLGWFLGLGYFLVSLRWLVEPFLVDAARHGWMAPFALALMAGGLALFWSGGAWIAARWAPGSRLALAFILTMAEALRGYVFTGFPWAQLGQILVDSPIAKLAAFAGPHGLGMALLGLGWSLWALGQRRLIGLAIPSAMLLLWLVPPVADDRETDGPMIRLVQPNAPQDEKWDPARRLIYFDRMLDYTGQSPRPALIVWPESAIPVLLDQAGPTIDLMTDAAGGVPLVFGVNRNIGLTFHNSFVVLDGRGQQHALYDKQHLVPFGEYIPFGEGLSWLGLPGYASSEGGGFTAGARDGLVEIPGIGLARALICYEGIFAHEIGQGERPRLMILITNDAWFGQGAGPAQHLAQARLRAIEQGLPMVRVANTGISAVIDAAGNVVAEIPLGIAGYLDVMLPAARPSTVYARWGDLPVLVFVIVAFGLTRRRRQSN